MVKTTEYLGWFSNVPHFIASEVKMIEYPGPKVSLNEPGLEGTIVVDNTEYGIVVHSVIDRDYEGQWAFFQICQHKEATNSFGSWHYVFYHRGNNQSWDHWRLRANHGLLFPGYAAFGSFVDNFDHFAQEEKEDLLIVDGYPKHTQSIFEL